MDEAELKEILASYRDAINALIERIEASAMFTAKFISPAIVGLFVFC